MVDCSLLNDSIQRLQEFELPRAMWTVLNRITTEQRTYNFLQHKLKMADTLLQNTSDVLDVPHNTNMLTKKKEKKENHQEISSEVVFL